jgi:hypothetical protein
MPAIFGAGPARFLIMDRNCPKCLGIGWVCEEHPDKAWHDELGCMCGAGMPCACNRDGDEVPDEDGTVLEIVVVKTVH